MTALDMTEKNFTEDLLRLYLQTAYRPVSVESSLLLTLKRSERLGCTTLNCK